MKFRVLAAVLLAAVIGALYLVFAPPGGSSAPAPPADAGADRSNPYRLEPG